MNKPIIGIVAKYCYQNDIPVLGICCDQNVIVRALGGTTKNVTNPEKHNQGDEDYVHSITIDKSPYLNQVAYCSDGYPDVVEASDKKFYIGVRFHPESLYKTDENMNNIFKSFIEACKNGGNNGV